MAHNTRIRAPGFWVALGVLDAAEMELVDAARYLSIHEGGGTWAITDNVVIGAIGAQTWHYTLPVVCDDLAAVVKMGKAVTFDSGSTLTVNGGYTLHGAGSITGVMTVGSNGAIIVTTGRAINFQAGSFLTISTAFATVGADAQVTFNGSSGHLANLVLGQYSKVQFLGGSSVEFTSSNWIMHTNSVSIIEAGAFVTWTIGGGGNAGTVNIGANGEVHVNSSGKLYVDSGGHLYQNGTQHSAGPEIITGNGYKRWRVLTLTGLDFDAGIANVDPLLWDEVVIPTALATGSTIIMTSADVPNDIRVKFRRDGNNDPNGCAIRVNGVDFFQFQGNTQSKSASATFIMWNTLWKIDDWSGRYGTDVTPLF